jgi:hypothetical protein
MKDRLTDEQVMEMVREFNLLSKNDKKKNLIGEGSWKRVYNTSNPDYVLKEIRKDTGGSREDVIKDYIASKQIGKHIPVEQPILATSGEGKDAFLIQKKLKSSGVTSDQLVDYENKLSNLGFETQPSGPDSGDIVPRNFATDNLGSLKAIDVDPEPYSFNKTLNDSLEKTRKSAIDKIGNSKVSRIYRAIPFIGPAIGAGIAAMSGEANAASAMPILGEADSLGPERGSEDYEIENPQRDPAARRDALKNILRNRK